jgi:copper chaperone
MVDMTTTIYPVSGMTCAHCVTAVTNELTSIADVENVSVELRVGEASMVSVTSTAALRVGDVNTAIEEAGYTLALEPAPDSS